MSIVIALLFPTTSGTNESRGFRPTTRPPLPGKDPVPFVQESEWAPGSVLTDGKSRPPPGFDPGPSGPYSHSLYRLSYPAQYILFWNTLFVCFTLVWETLFHIYSEQFAMFFCMVNWKKEYYGPSGSGYSLHTGGTGCRCVRLTTLPPFCAVVMKSGNLYFMLLSEPLQACNGIDLPFFFYFTLWKKQAWLILPPKRGVLISGHGIKKKKKEFIKTVLSDAIHHRHFPIEWFCLLFILKER